MFTSRRGSAFRPFGSKTIDPPAFPVEKQGVLNLGQRDCGNEELDFKSSDCGAFTSIGFDVLTRLVVAAPVGPGRIPFCPSHHPNA